jgi:hypothetical protein
VTFLLVTTHLIAAAIGALLTWIVIQSAQAQPLVPHHEHHRPDERTHNVVKQRAHVNPVAIALLVLALVIVLYGFSQQRANHQNLEEATRQRACFAKVVDQLSESQTQRSAANARLQQATNAKSDATDGIFAVFIEANANGNKSTPALRRKFSQALAEFAKAKKAQAAASANYDRVRAQYPAPPSVKESCQ